MRVRCQNCGGICSPQEIEAHVVDVVGLSLVCPECSGHYFVAMPDGEDIRHCECCDTPGVVCDTPDGEFYHEGALLPVETWAMPILCYAPDGHTLICNACFDASVCG